MYGEVEALITLLGYKSQNAGCCKVGWEGLRGRRQCELCVGAACLTLAAGAPLLS